MQSLESVESSRTAGSASSGEDLPEPDRPQTGGGKITSKEILAGLSDKEKNWMELTPEQYLQDFDSLYHDMEENYPYFHVALRKKGIDIAGEYSYYRGLIADCKNDDDFFNTVRQFAESLDYTGHIYLWGYRYSRELQTLQNFVVEFPEYKEQLTPYLDKLDNPVSKKNYTAMEEFYESIDRLVLEANAQSHQETEDTADAESGAEELSAGESGKDGESGKASQNIP